MDVLNLMYKLRDRMFDDRLEMSIPEKDACLILSALISYKLVNSSVIHELQPNGGDILTELHLLNHSEELFSVVPFSDNEIVEIIEECRNYIDLVL